MGHRKGDPRPDQVPQVEPGENARMVRFSMELWKQPKCDMSDMMAVYQRCVWFLEFCASQDMRPTVEGLALAMGYSRDQLLNIKDGNVKSVPTDVTDTLKRTWQMMNQNMTQYMVDGHLNPATAIFLLKNNYGYKDVVETVVAKKDPYETGNPEEIARKYLQGAAPSIEAPQENARTDAPLVETVVVDQTGTVE